MKKITIVLTLVLTVFIVNAQQVNFQWAKSVGSINDDEAFSVAVDGLGNIYTTGYFQDTVDFDPGLGVFNLISAGDWDAYISKFDALGNFIWAKRLGGIGRDYGYSIFVDTANKIYITGLFNTIADFSPTTGTVTINSNSNEDLFILKLDASGNVNWVKVANGPGSSHGWSINIDGNNNIYVAGGFYDTVDFDPGAGIFNLTSAGHEDIFILKLDNNGNFLWAKQMGGVNGDQVFSITTDSFGNVYSTGYFQGVADFDPSASTYNFSSTLSDIFISKLDASGNFVWAKQLVGSNTIAGTNIGTSLCSDAVGNIYVTGRFSATTDFDPGIGSYSLTAAAVVNAFIMKLDHTGNFLWAKQITSSASTTGNCIIKDISGNIYTIGWFSGNADFDPGVGVFNLNSYGDYDVFISKLDSAGNFVWAEQIGGTSTDIAYSITLDISNNLVCSGSFKNIADFDPTSTSYNLPSSGGFDAFTHKMSQAVLGVKENFGENYVNIYPNPTNTILNIKVDPESFEKLSGTKKVEISNTLGQVVLCDNMNTNHLQLTTKNLNSGLYILKIINDNKIMATKKIIKE